MKTCIFCDINENKFRVIKTFNYCIAIEDQFPVSPGHILIIPYKHFPDWFSITKEIQIDILEAIDFLKKYLDDQYQPDGYNIGINNGTAAGQTVMHVHIHLIPRYHGDAHSPRGGVRGVIPSKQQY